MIVTGIRHLRREFIAGVIRLYTSVCRADPDERLLFDLRRIADICGAALTTPREVQLTLNALAFRYSGLRDYVWLPDLCFLLLIQTVNPELYDWTEHYLTERAVVESGDGAVSEAEHAEMVSSLGQYLSLFRSSEAKSATSFSHWVPLLPAGALKSLQHRLALRLSSPDVRRQFVREGLLLTHIWAWRDISGLESVRAWFQDQTSEDEKFLNLLLAMRYRGVSTATGFYRALNRSQLTEFLGNVDESKIRLTEIEVRGNYSDHVSEVKAAISRNRF